MTAICPSCGSGCDIGATRCVACGASLTVKHGGTGDAVEWVTIEETDEESQAALVEEFLLENGLPVRMLNHRGHEGPAADGGSLLIEVQVIDDHLDRALEILARLDDQLDPPAG